MGGIGISNGMNRYGVTGPANRGMPAGNNAVSDPDSKQWYESGPFWTLVFLLVGYMLVFQTLRS